MKPIRLPDPQIFGPQWATQLTGALNRWFEGLKGDDEVLGRLITLSGRQKFPTYVTSASYAARLADHVIDINFAGAVAIELPEAPPTGTEWVFLDTSGAAASNHITLDPLGATTINGAGTLVLSTNYVRRVVYFNGTKYIAG